MLWRLILQALLALILLIPVFIVLGIITTVVALSGAVDLTTMSNVQMVAFFQSQPVILAATSLSVALVVFLSVWISARLFDRRPLEDFGLRFDAHWAPDLAFGLLLGALLMTGVFLAELAFGWVRVTGFLQASTGSFGGGIIAGLVSFVCVGIYEELLSRGYHMSNLAQGLRKLIGPRGGLLAGWVFSSAFFALGHLANPGASAISTFNILLAGLLLLGLGYLLTGSLAIPIGVHITWNFFQGNVFGFPVSGTLANQVTFIATESVGPQALTGGAFGPEAGLVGVAAMLLGALLILVWVRWRRGALGLYLPMSEAPAGASAAHEGAQP